ncbi:MAG: hypothetical protein K2H18_00405 [Muribaculaceae bacterium]|nr:hypothetical protein [Muribaculaceae bacterium]
MRYATIYFLLVIFLAMLSSCRTVTKYVPVESVRTEYREADTAAIFNRLLKIFESRKEKEVKTDSLVDREKETVVLNVQGDTVKQIQTKYVYRATQREKELEKENKTLRDCISSLNTRLESIKTDSVPVPYPVERELSRWQQAKMNFGGMAIGGLIAVVIVFIIVWLIKKFKK